MFEPRVSAARTGRELQIINRDMTMFKVQAYRSKERKSWFNLVQPPGAPPIKKELAAGMVQLKCGLHPWMAAYIDLNPVRAGLVQDSKDYRFCGYAEAVAGRAQARSGLRDIWGAYADGSARDRLSTDEALRMHRELILGHRAAEPGLSDQERERTLNVLAKGGSTLPKATVLRCRVRYFTDGAILGSKEYVRGFIDLWQIEKVRKYPPKVNVLCGADWAGEETAQGQELACIQGLRKAVFG